MRLFVTGANGQLGQDVVKEAQRRDYDVIATDLAELDITDPAAAERVILAAKPDCVVHCAAYTAVDRAEKEPELCEKINKDGTRNIALACQKAGAKMIYLSTDYVFDGEGDDFFTPESHPAPCNTYGMTKYQGEVAVRSLLEQYFIVRISWVFGLWGRNFVKTMISLAETRDEIGVICDQIGSPTYTKDLAPLLLDMAQSDRYGIYHATNSGVCSWFDFACEIFRLTGQTIRVRALTSEEYPAAAKRPKNSRLSKKKLVEAGFSPLPAWQDALRDFISKYYWEENNDGKDSSKNLSDSRTFCD